MVGIRYRLAIYPDFGNSAASACQENRAIPQQSPNKQSIDLDTLRAVVLNRLHVMAEFGREVVLPVLREELRKADDSRRQMLKRARAC
jgi:predicted 2-oxoglutarate/Fe(II)-dependent dioxygenase YbiX